MNLFTEKVLLTPETCEVATQRVIGLHPYWLDRVHFSTLGTSAYLDKPPLYYGMAANTNLAIANNFDWLSKTVANFLQENLNREITVESNKALPGFHIFDQRANGVQGSIHTDESYKDIDWRCTVADPFTFVLPISIPECGAGLNYWNNQADADDPKVMAQYLKYELGTLYLFAGDIPHQIANDGDLEEGDFRITFQGHGLHLDNGKIIVYF